MLPEDSFNFNGFSPSSNFDHSEVRWPHPVQQDAVPALETERYLLGLCPVCKQPWYKAGRLEYPRLTSAQLAFLGVVLQVDIQALYLLPRAICTICSAVHLGGLFSAEAYASHGGYRFLWESASPRRIQLLTMVCTVLELSLDALVQMTPLRVVEPTDEIRTVLTWLESAPSTEALRVLTHEQRQHLAQQCPPDSATDETTCQWSGYAWKASCAPLGGDALIVLAVTTRPGVLPPVSSLRMSWQLLARALRVVL